MPPTTIDAAKASDLGRKRKPQGFASTVLGAGLEDQNPATKIKTLLGQ